MYKGGFRDVPVSTEAVNVVVSGNDVSEKGGIGVKRRQRVSQ
jgi:hypothetical protein